MMLRWLQRIRLPAFPHLSPPRGRWRWALPLVALGILVAPWALIRHVSAATQPYRYDDPSHVPAERVAIVFGAGLQRDGTPSPMLAARVQAAIDLYHAGHVRKLLLTGDNSMPDYDEVSAMRRYAVARGVPPEDITLDYAGFSTYDSCYRARVIFGVTDAVLVTQNFHLPRAVYICRQLGVNAVGLGTPDWGVYSARTVEYLTLREMVATLKALVDVHITLPRPTYLGKYEGIS